MPLSPQTTRETRDNLNGDPRGLDVSKTEACERAPPPAWKCRPPLVEIPLRPTKATQRYIAKATVSSVYKLPPYMALSWQLC